MGEQFLGPNTVVVTPTLHGPHLQTHLLPSHDAAWEPFFLLLLLVL